MPFQYQDSRAPAAGSIAELMIRRGDIAARRAEQIGNAEAGAAQASGNAWAGAAQNIGQSVAALPGQIQQQKEQALRQQALKQNVDAGALQLEDKQRQKSDLAALDAAFANGTGRDAILNAVPGHLRPDVMKQFQEADRLGAEAKKAADAARQTQAEHFGFLGAQIKQANYDPTTALAAIHQARETYADDSNLVKQIDQLRMAVIEQPESIKQVADAAILGSSYKDMLKPPPQKTRAELAADAANPLSPSQKQSATALDLMNPPKEPPKAPAVGTFEDYVVRKYGSNPTPQQIEQGRRVFGDAGRVTVVTPPGGASDAKETIAGMMDGTIPPVMPGRASKEYTALMAEAHRQGFNLQGAVTDWAATQKHIASMNGAQQLRLNQAVNSLPDMLDKVDALASQWKGGRFPILNRANLAAAKGGVYGPDVASVANQLDAQIADVTADLGNVYMGGNSPTDHALGLAGKSLSGDWSEKVLHDMVKLARSNVQIRKNSINSTGVAGASQSNPYNPPQAAPTIDEWVRDANGKLVKKGAK